MALVAGAVVRRDWSGRQPDGGGPPLIIAGQDVGFWQRLLCSKQKIPLRDKDVGASIEVIS
jgi:hypothetical protein